MWTCLQPQVQSRETARETPAPRSPAPVILHVYDLGVGREVQAMNSVLHKFGTGAFHCGVEVYGQEWSFQYSTKGTGIFQVKPKGCSHHTYRESIAMGTTNMTDEEVDLLINRFQREWPAKSYEVLTRNCCHCCDEFCIALGVGPIPFWTRNLAAAGCTVRTVYEGVTELLNPSLLTSGCLTTRRDVHDKDVTSFESTVYQC